MDKKQKKQIRKIISWVLIAALVVLLAIMPMLARNGQNSDEVQASILSATAEKATIQTRLLGGGTLQSQEAVEVTVPADVKLTGYLVGNGDLVKEGDAIATVDPVTVMTAISQVQETMEELREDIQDAGEDEAPDTVTAQADGLVKTVYAQKGDKVQDVMLQYGALAVLSLDGKMAVQVQTQTDRMTGDAVTVSVDGEEREGLVETNREGILTVVFPDEGDAPGQTVTVLYDGNLLGTGEMYIHSQWNAVAYSGTVSSVKVDAGEDAQEGDTLFKLTDTGHTAEFYQLTQLHREYEDLMLELFGLYQTRTLTAPATGVVTGVDTDGAYMLAASGGYTLQLLANAPNGDDETSYINYVGRITAVGPEGLAVNINPQILQIPDYTDLSGVPLDTALMTQSVVYSGTAPVYELQEGQWVQLDASALKAEDILLFAGDMEGNFVWLVRVQSQTQPEEPSQPEDPTTPTDPVYPSYPSYPNVDFSGIYGSYGSYGGTTQTVERYTLDTVTVASVTSQEEMILQITVDETDIGSIQVGQQADITVDALTGERFTALVTRVSGTGENSGGNSKFTVELKLEKSGDMLPGMTASAFFTLDTAREVLCVPVAALVEQGTQTLVYTGYDAENEVLINPVTVTVGVSDGENVQILSGLHEGDTYYYAYYDTLVISNTPDMNDYDFF